MCGCACVCECAYVCVCVRMFVLSIYIFFHLINYLLNCLLKSILFFISIFGFLLLISFFFTMHVILALHYNKHVYQLCSRNQAFIWQPGEREREFLTYLLIIYLFFIIFFVDLKSYYSQIKSTTFL